MNVLVTGGAGFIGSHLVDRLLKDGHNVTVLDDLSSGRKENIKHAASNGDFRFVQGDIKNACLLKDVLRGQEFVWHLAANADIRHGMEHTKLDLENNTLGTFNLLEAMRKNNVKRLAFSSSSTVYGEARIPTPEDHPLVPISLYGASKAANEALKSAYCHSFGFQAWIFRFANIVGSRHRRGVIYDFIRKLKENPKELTILGDGRQEKSFLRVSECIDAMQIAIKNSSGRLNIFNLGNCDKLIVNEIANIVIDEMRLEHINIGYSEGDRGWLGDIPKTFLSTDKIRNLGWEPKADSRQTIRIVTRELLEELR